MFITKKALPRRTFLKGVGVTVALPFLESMVPAMRLKAQAPAAPVRAAFVYWSNGTIPEQWIPTATGRDFPFSPIMKPLEGFRDRTLVLSGLDINVEGTHPTASAGWLTGVSAKPTEGDDVYNNTSIDQVIAEQIGHETVLPSLELATEDFSSAIGACAGGYSCIYANTISWKTPETPLPMEINPRLAFERMFGRAGSAEQRAARLQRQKSVLDSVSSELGMLRRDIGTPDRRRLDAYLTNLREVEARIQRAESMSSNDIMLPVAPVGIPASHDEHLRLMFDLMALAFQADVTRVATFYTSRELSQVTYPQVGVAEPHHVASHHGNSPDRLGMMVRIGAYYAQVLSEFLGKLESMTEEDETILDRSMVFYGNGMSNSDEHMHVDLPLAVFGGQFEGNRHIRHESLPLSNLWLSTAARFGSERESFGDSTGRLEV